MFGQSNANTGGIFGQQNQQQPQQSGGLFGSKPATGGLFGGQQANQQQSGGLFGQQNQQQQQAGGGLFGAKPATGGATGGVYLEPNQPLEVCLGDNKTNNSHNKVVGCLELNQQLL